MSCSRSFARLVACSTALFAFLFTCAPRAAEDAKLQPDLRKQIIGAWQLVSKADGGALDEGFDGQIKFIGDKHWTAVRIDPKTKKLSYTLGGTYALKGDEYVETVEFASEDVAQMIGSKLTFKLKVDGDKLRQTGVGNPYSQSFRRAK